MSKILFISILVASFSGYLMGQRLQDDPNKNKEEKSTVESKRITYTCPMHAEIVQHEKGSCPICGMDLVKQKFNDAAVSENGLPVVTVSSPVIHNLGIRTSVARNGELKRSIETIGKITRVDAMARRTITPPIRGELVYIADKREGDLVEAGELLFSVQSDELFEHQKTFQDTYLSGDRATANAMIPQLSEMGLTPEQIALLQSNNKPQLPVSVYAFEDGFIYTRRGQLGEKVHTGFTVFNVGGNYRVIEVTAEIFEQQWGWVKDGQTARMTVRGLPGIIFEGLVVRVEPPVGYTTRSLEVGLHFKTDNMGLSQSMFAHISIEGQSLMNVLLVPTDSVIRTGQGDRVVLLRGENQFQPVSVVAGEEADGLIEIRSGLQAGDMVVASGQFLIDSESSLRAGLRRLQTPGVELDMPEHAEHRHEAHQHDVNETVSGQKSVDGKVAQDI